MKDASLFENYKKTVNSKQVILLTLGGSELLGLDKKEESDRDEVGVCLETIKEATGFERYDTPVIYRTAADRTGRTNEPSKPGDIDLTLYGLRHFLKLALGGNPNLVNLFYVPEDKCILRTFLGQSLQELAPKIISKQVGKAFSGYLTGQRLQLLGTKGQKGVKRPVLEGEFGYDIKYAMHMIRLGIQGYEILTTGKLQLPMQRHHLESLQDIRAGFWSYERCIEYGQLLQEDIDREMGRSNLPEKPDYAAVEDWLITTYKNAWKAEYEEKTS